MPRKQSQRSKSRGSHGAKAGHPVHAGCIACRRHQPIRRLNADKVCVRCVRQAYGKKPVARCGTCGDALTPGVKPFKACCRTLSLYVDREAPLT